MSENIIIARFIPDNSSVIDLGAGAQTLRKHLQGVADISHAMWFRARRTS